MHFKVPTAFPSPPLPALPLSLAKKKHKLTLSGRAYLFFSATNFSLEIMRKQAGPFFYDYVKLDLPSEKSKLGRGGDIK